MGSHSLARSYVGFYEDLRPTIMFDPAMREPVPTARQPSGAPPPLVVIVMLYIRSEAL